MGLGWLLPDASYQGLDGWERQIYRPRHGKPPRLIRGAYSAAMALTRARARYLGAVDDEVLAGARAGNASSPGMSGGGIGARAMAGASTGGRAAVGAVPGSRAAETGAGGHANGTVPSARAVGGAGSASVARAKGVAGAGQGVRLPPPA